MSFRTFCEGKSSPDLLYGKSVNDGNVSHSALTFKAKPKISMDVPTQNPRDVGMNSNGPLSGKLRGEGDTVLLCYT